MLRCQPFYEKKPQMEETMEETILDTLLQTALDPINQELGRTHQTIDPDQVS